MAERERKGAWDFYPCRVDDAPASIFLDLSHIDDHPPLDTLYYAGLQMLDEGEHGMGSPQDAEVLWALEDVIVAKAADAGLIHVARMRNDGDWQLSFYGDPGKEEQLRAIVIDALIDEGERGYRLGSQEDPEWGYYHDFLLPDEERWQWIMDRRVIEQLHKSGDQHDIPREVDHFIHFAQAEQRDACAAAARALGFRTDDSDRDDDAELPFGLSLHRDDPVELQHIHDVVMTLRALADEHHGDYDGWGCVVVGMAPN